MIVALGPNDAYGMGSLIEDTQVRATENWARHPSELLWCHGPCVVLHGGIKFPSTFGGPGSYLIFAEAAVALLHPPSRWEEIFD